MTSGSEIGGVDGDILKSIAKSACLTLTPVVVDPAATIQYVISGKADIAGGDWYRTAERAKVLGLSAPTYLDQMGIYSKDGASTVAAMMGKQVGTVSGFLWVADLQKLLGSNLHLYPNPVALAQDLQAGRIQIGVDSYGTRRLCAEEGRLPRHHHQGCAAGPRACWHRPTLHRQICFTPRATRPWARRSMPTSRRCIRTATSRSI